MLSIDHHVDAICRGCYANIRRLARIRKYLSTNSAAILVSAILASKLDYWNSLLSGVSHFNITRPQRVQHRLVRVIFKLPSWSHITLYMTCLHWLPIKEHIDFKLVLLSLKAVNINQPSYLSELLTRRSACHMRQLRDRGSIDVKPFSSHAGERAFGVCAPRLWNDLPTGITYSATLTQFKSRLKTHLFKRAFPLA